MSVVLLDVAEDVDALHLLGQPFAARLLAIAEHHFRLEGWLYGLVHVLVVCDTVGLVSVLQ